MFQSTKWVPRCCPCHKTGIKCKECDSGLCKVPQETQSPVTKLFRRLGGSDSSSETVNLVKVKKKKTPSAKGDCCTEAGMQTNTCNPEDTFSFTSCSLKKILASESPKLMMALILAVGALTVWLGLKCVWCPSFMSDLTETRERRSNDAVSEDERKPWESSRSKLMSEISELTGKGTREINLHSGGEDYPEYLSPDLSSILDPIKVNEGYSSHNLRDFYRKLLKTDIQIKNLKKGFANTKRGNIDSSDPNARLKRSLRIFSGPKKHSETPLKKGNFNNYPLGDDSKTAIDILKNKGNSGGSDLEKEKSHIKEEKLHHEREANDKEHNNVPFKLYKTEDLKTGKDKIKRYNKYTHWLETLLSRESPATRHRRLLQHDDDDDFDSGATEDYEEQTKEAGEREKRTASVKTLEIYVESYTSVVPERRKTKLKTSTTTPLKSTTPSYSEEINYLIDAAIKMKSGKINDMKHRESKPIKEDIEEANGNYNELVAMAQAYSDYGVLDSKKDIIGNNIAPGNTNSMQSDKSHKTVEWFDNVDNQHGLWTKLKSNGASKAKTDTLSKKLDRNTFSKFFHTIKKTETTKSSNLNKIINSTISTITFRLKSNPKTNQQHKERNVMFSGHRRSLKSIETGESNDELAISTSDIGPNVNNSDQLPYIEKDNVKYISDIRDSEHEPNNATNKANETIDSIAHEQKAKKINEGTYKHNNSTSWGLGEVFGTLADLCMFLAGFDANRDDSGYRFLYDFVTMLNPNYSRNKTLPEKGMNDTRSIENSIDSKRVENIGYRSRALLSFEEPVENVTSTTYAKDVNESYVVTSKKYGALSTKRDLIVDGTYAAQSRATLYLYRSIFGDAMSKIFGTK